MFTPCIILGKQLIQSAWKLKIPWDEELPNDILKQWTLLSNHLSSVFTVSVPRQVCCESKRCTLAIFCDASTKAYGAVAYIVSENQSNLLTSKALATPLKERTLPQLELTALQVGVQLASYIHDTLSNIPIERTVVFTDNEATLQWIRNESSTITYVKNQVHCIRELLSKYSIEIYHVPSKENSADLLSRGVTFSKFQEKFEDFWFKGPTWLTCPSQFPVQRSHVVVNEITTDVPVPIHFSSQIV